MPDNGHPVTRSVSPKTSALPVVIIGAGPVGLAAAAHLLEQGCTPLVFEAGARVGHAIRQWGHVRLFSPWHECLDPTSVHLLQAEGWRSPEVDGVPTGRELVEQYLEPLAAVPGIAPHVHLSSRVVAVGREYLDKVRTAHREQAPFVVHVEQAGGQRVVHRAQAVIDTSGTWASPNPMGAGGIAVAGEVEAADRIRYGIPDVLGAERSRYASRRVLVVGGGTRRPTCCWNWPGSRSSTRRRRLAGPSVALRPKGPMAARTLMRSKVVVRWASAFINS